MFVFTLSLLSTSFINSQNSVNVGDSISFLNSSQNIVINDAQGFIEVNGTPDSENDDSVVYFGLSNKGSNGGKHLWKMSTSSYAGNVGVSSNGYEIWEYPANVSLDDCCKRRLVIQTSRDYPTDYSPFIIGPRGRVSIGYPSYFSSSDMNDLSVNGNVGIGTLDTQGYKLSVNGTIRAKEIKVDSDWADFVFKKDYKLPTLREVETHINENGTLPGVPSESEVKANGINLAETNALLLQKIEELTLYVIKQQEEIEQLKALNNK